MALSKIYFAVVVFQSDGNSRVLPYFLVFDIYDSFQSVLFVFSCSKVTNTHCKFRCDAQIETKNGRINCSQMSAAFESCLGTTLELFSVEQTSENDIDQKISVFSTKHKVSHFYFTASVYRYSDNYF